MQTLRSQRITCSLLKYSSDKWGTSETPLFHVYRSRDLSLIHTVQQISERENGQIPEMGFFINYFI